MNTLSRIVSLAMVLLLLFCTVAVNSGAGADAARAPDAVDKVEPQVLREIAAKGATDFVVWMTEKADLSPAAALATKAEKGRFVYATLVDTADRTQGAIRRYLDGQGADYQPFYIANIIAVHGGGEALLLDLAARPDVARIVSPPDPRPEPIFLAMSPAERVAAVEWNVARIHAPEVWELGLGYRGEGMVVGSNDTGVQYTHPALVGHYRGNLGGGDFDHNYNWWDGPEGYPYPYDYDGHGTHTTGTMVGDDGGANQIGVAPGARWIACGGLGGTDTLDCFQFFLAPWDLTGENPDPDKAPDAINNSWYDPSPFDYRPIVQALHAAGIAVIKSAGNDGPGCSTISNPGYVPEIIATAAFAEGDVIASFSSRGPSDYYGETILKPEVAAPGANVRSSVPTDGYDYYSGTSMAAPHTTALVALMWNAAPCLRGDVPTTKDLMMWTAEPKIDAQCAPFVTHPNDVWGWGILNAEAAVLAARGYCEGLGTLEGTVSDAVTESPVSGAQVTAHLMDGGRWDAITDPAGTYTMSVLGGTYTVTVEAYGYDTGVATGVVVVTDATTTQDFALTPSPQYVVSGLVTEEGTGTPLPAQVQVVEPEIPVPPVLTDPATGYYSITVAAGTYTFRASAALHIPDQREVVANMDQTQNFVLATLPCLLLVDDDNNTPDVTPYYAAALDGLGYDYAVFDVAGAAGDGPSAADLTGYQGVIWFSGAKYGSSAGPNAADEAALTAYLNDGGRLFLSSQDYLYDFGLTPFGENYLGIGSFTNDGGGATAKYGVAGDPIGDGLGPYPLTYPEGFNDYGDVVNAGAGASLAFRSASGGGKNLDVDKDGGDWRTVFFGTSWVPIYANNAANGEQVLERIIDWFDACDCEPVAGVDFTWEPEVGTVGEPIAFTALGPTAGTPPFVYTWDFGDGSTSGEQDPMHVYTATGDYTVTLFVDNCDATGLAVAEHVVTVEPPCEPVEGVDFTWEPEVGTVGESIAFTAVGPNSGTPPFVYTWDFGDDSTSGLEDPTHVYTAAGDYTVTLFVDNCDAAGLAVAEHLVTVEPPCDPVDGVDFTWEPEIGIVGEPIMFYAEVMTGTEPIVYTWDFGDGSTSGEKDPMHVFTATRTYTVTLFVDNCDGAGSAMAEHTVLVEAAEMHIYLPIVLRNF